MRSGLCIETTLRELLEVCPLIDAYDFPAIMRAAKVIATKRKEKLDRNFDCEIARLREIFGVVIRRLDCEEKNGGKV